ncbi:MAG: PilN domain-containing protein [Smithella sp.]
MKVNTAEIIEKIKSIISEMELRAARFGKVLWRILSLNLADDRVMPMKVLSVALEYGNVSVVYASRFLSRIKIKGISHYTFEKGKYPTPENVSSAITLASNELWVSRAQVVMVVPKSWTIVKTTDFPLAVKENISAVVSNELDRLTPLSPEKAFYDFQIIGEEEDRLLVMVAAVNSDVLQPYLDSLQEKKTIVRRISVSSSAVGTLCDYAHGSGSVIFLIISGNGYEGGVIRDHKWFASFTGRLTGEDEQSNILIIAAEVKPFLEEDTEVIIDHFPIEEWRLRLQESIQVPVRFIRELDLKVHFSNGKDFDKVSSPALGGALEHLLPGASNMNLLDQGKHQSAGTPFGFTIILIIILIALSLFWLISPLQIEKLKLETINREIDARKNEVKKIELLQKNVENIQNEISTIRAFKSSRPMMMNILKEMTRILPRNTWLSRMRIADTTIEIEGYAASATEIVPKLEASPYFKKVEFSSPTSRDLRMNADRFAIKMEIEGLPEEKLEHGEKK